MCTSNVQGGLFIQPITIDSAPFVAMDLVPFVIESCDIFNFKAYDGSIHTYQIIDPINGPIPTFMGSSTAVYAYQSVSTYNNGVTLTLKQNIAVDFDARSITSAGDANYQIDVDATRRTGKTRAGQLVFHIIRQSSMRAIRHNGHKIFTQALR